MNYGGLVFDLYVFYQQLVCWFCLYGFDFQYKGCVGVVWGGFVGFEIVEIVKCFWLVIEEIEDVEMVGQQCSFIDYEGMFVVVYDDEIVYFYFFVCGDFSGGLLVFKLLIWDRKCWNSLGVIVMLLGLMGFFLVVIQLVQFWVVFEYWCR